MDSLIDKNFVSGLFIEFPEDFWVLEERIVGLELLEVDLLGMVVGIVVFEEDLAFWLADKWII